MNCLTSFLVKLSNNLKLPNADNASLVAHTDVAITTYNLNDPMLNFGKFAESEALNLEKHDIEANFLLTEFDAFLLAIVIAVIFVIVVVIAIMSFNISDAILVVVFAIIICAVGLWGIFKRSKVFVPTDTIETDLEGFNVINKNRINSALCAYSSL